MKIFRTSDFIMAAAWMAAFILSLPLVEPHALARLGAIACMAAFGAVGLGRELAGPGLPAPRSPVFWAVPGLWILSLASVAWSAAPMVSYIGFSTLSLLALGFVVFACGRGVFRMLIVLAPPVWLALAGLGVLTMAHCPLWADHGAFLSRYAVLLALGLFPAVGLSLSASNRKVIMGAVTVSAVLLAGIMAGGDAVLAALTVFGLVLTAWVCRGRLGMHQRGFALIAAAGVAGLGLRFLPQAATADAGLEAAPSRLAALGAIWRATGAMIRDHILLGTGYGTYFLTYPQYRPDGDLSQAVPSAHNDVLQLWAETGLAAPLLLLVIAGGALMRMGVVLKRRGPGSGERAICFSLFVACGVTAAYALTDSGLYAASVLALLGMMLGLWFRYTGLVLADRLAPVALPAGMPRGAGWALVILPLFLMAFAAQGFLRSEYYADRAQASLAAGDFAAFQIHVQQARHASFDRNARPYLLAASIPMGVLQTGRDTLSPAAKTQIADGADALLARAEARSPRQPAIYYDRAVMARYGLEEKGDENARDWLAQALSVDPGHIPSRLMLADIEHGAGHMDRALDILAGGLDRAPARYNPESLYEMTATLAGKAGRTALHEKALIKLKEWREANGDKAAVNIDAVPAPLE